MARKLRVTTPMRLGRFSTYTMPTFICRTSIVLMALVFASCAHRPAGQNTRLAIDAQSASIDLSMNLLPNQLGKFAIDGKFIGVLPRTLSENSQAQDIDLYVIDAPTFTFPEFTLDTIARQRLKATKITSLQQLTDELNAAKLGFGNLVVARKVDATVTGGKLTVKELEGSKTTVECTCPCTVSFGDDKVKYSC